MCCSQSGFVYKFFPDGRLESNTILDNVKVLLESIPQRQSKDYVVAMDNLFTTPKVLELSRELNVGIVGTARARRGWPPKEFRNVKDERFNTVYTLNDERNFLILRWVDNNIVTMVSTIHTGEETIVRNRRKPRVTSTNKNHLNTVWGNRPKVPISNGGRSCH